MRQTKIVLTSIVALVIATPAMAAVGDVITTGASCTIGDLGVSSGTANATAQFSVNSYNCAAGTYLPAGDTWTAAEIAANDGRRTCPAGSYCWGSGYEENGVFIYSDDEDQGITSCEDNYSGSTSDAGATSSEMCYYTVSCPTISAATACDTHAATCAYTTPANATNKRLYPETREFTGSCAMTFTCATGYASGTPDSAITAPNSNADSREHKSHDNNNVYPNNTTLNSGEWSATWNSTGTIKGIASCNAVPGDNHSWAWGGDSSDWTMPANNGLMSNSADANDSSRRYCWCKPTSWTPSGGSEQLLSAAWVFIYDLGGASGCASNCASNCAYYVNRNAGFRSALFGQIGASPQCVANNITLSWNNENGTQFTSGSCTYDESLTVPSTHPDKRGYTFTGWKFVSPSQN